MLSAIVFFFVLLLDCMEENLVTGDRFMFYGYLCGNWNCLFGPWPGVFTNQEVDEA